MKKLLVTIFAVTVTFAGRSIAEPVVSNVSAAQRTGTNVVDITYDVSSPACTSLTVAVAASTNNGASYDLPVWNFSGDGYGLGVEPGTNRQVAWHVDADRYWLDSTQVWVKIVVSDRFDTNQMSLVPAGSFIMGNYVTNSTLTDICPDPGESDALEVSEMASGFVRNDYDEYPVHTVWLKTFSMAKMETSSEEMRRVMQWAFDNGKIEASAFGVTNIEGDQQLLIAMTNYYCDLAFSNGVFSVKDGKTNFPMVSITWHGAQAYCNYRSEMEGLEQCIDFSDWSCDFTRMGYRLPTEAEWEKAARGGLEGNYYPWTSSGGSYTQHICATRANYIYSGDPYESYYDGRTPIAYYDGNQIITNDTCCATNDMFNGYGLYDMAGNVSDLCYDWYSFGYYEDSPSRDPLGGSTGIYHSVRGGSWTSGQNNLFLRCSNRGGLLTAHETYYHGYRWVRAVVLGESGDFGPLRLMTSDDNSLVPVYRLYSYGSTDSTYEHLWTTSETEKDILDSWPSWQYEGIAWYALPTQYWGSVGLYRLYEPNVKQHHYTISSTEYEALTNTSWSGEGIQYYVYPTNTVSGLAPAYRFYHSGLCLHHFTISEDEKASITNHPEWGYVYEGVGFYVFATNVTGLVQCHPFAPPSQKNATDGHGKATEGKSNFNVQGCIAAKRHKMRKREDGTAGAAASLKSNTLRQIDAGRTSPVQDRVCNDSGRTDSLPASMLHLASDIEHRIPLPGDYDGDGIEDIAYYEEPTGIWYLLCAAEEYDILGPHPSDTAMKSEEYQQVGRAFLPYRDRQECLSYLGCEQWLALDLRFQIAPLAQWGGPGFIPFSIDYDGDGISDLGVYDEDTLEWYVMSVDGRILVWMSEKTVDENTCNGKELSQ